MKAADDSACLLASPAMSSSKTSFVTVPSIRLVRRGKLPRSTDRRLLSPYGSPSVERRFLAGVGPQSANTEVTILHIRVGCPYERLDRKERVRDVSW